VAPGAVPADLAAPGTLLPLKDSGSRPPLYCVHPASGSAYGYAGLAGSMPADQPVYGLEAPGFDDDREPIGSVPGLAAAHVAAIGELLPAGIGALLGWSTGGLVAYEMAARLGAAGVAVPQLIVVDAPAPAAAPLPAERDILRQFVHDLLGALGAPVPDLDAVVAGWPTADPAAVFAAVEQAELFPAEIDTDFLQQRYRVFRASVVAMYSYRPGAAARRAVTLVTASRSRRDLMRWADVTGPVTEHAVPGDHYTIWSGPGLAALSRVVRACLDEAGPTQPTEGQPR
jgi:thioesterase domain-containing protein